MLRLSLKDLIVSRNQILISLAFWTILTPALLRSSVGIYYIAIVFGAFILFMIPLGMDSRDNTEVLYISLPIRKKTIIFARYISSIILTVIIFGWSTLTGFLIDRYSPNINTGFIEMISTGGVFLLFCLALFIIAIMIPVFIKFGFYISIFTGIFVSVLVLAGFATAFSGLISLNYGQLLPEKTADASLIAILTGKDLIYLMGRLLGDFRYYLTIPLITALMCLLIFISFKISTGIYSKKEF